MTFLAKKSASAIAIIPVTAEDFAGWLKKQDKKAQGWIKASGFAASPGAMLAIPDKDHGVAHIIFGVPKKTGLYTYAALPGQLPKNDAGYYIDKKLDADEATQAALGWALGSYAFSAYKSARKKDFARLIWPDNADQDAVTATAEAVYLVRSLVNTPANDLGPQEIAEAALKVAKGFKGSTAKVITGTDLLKQNYPAIYHVGKGSPRAPRLVDIRWGNPKHPLLTLVGKGVAFDTGGLDIKSPGNMYLMKKDMGGAAHVMGLAHMIMAANLPVRLRVLIPTVENATDGNSYRPSDILKTRKGISVEVGDTDAEGRLILCDALAEANSEKPALIIDFATLTGAARVALGPELPAMFSNNDDAANALIKAAGKTEDPLWRLPLWQPYKDMLNSKVADSNNIGGTSFGGAIIAALFLDKFVDADVPWIHIDTYAWNMGSRPGRPDGGEALGMRACFEMIKATFGKKA